MKGRLHIYVSVRPIRGLRLVHSTGFIPLVKVGRMKQDDRKVVCNPLLVYPVLLCFTHQKGFVAASQTVSRATELKLFTLSSVVLEILLTYSIILLIFTKEINQVSAKMSELDPLCGYTEAESGARAPTFNHYNRMKKSLSGRRNCKIITFSTIM